MAKHSGGTSREGSQLVRSSTNRVGHPSRRVWIERQQCARDSRYANVAPGAQGRLPDSVHPLSPRGGVPTPLCDPVSAEYRSLRSQRLPERRGVLQRELRYLHPSGRRVHPTGVRADATVRRERPVHPRLPLVATQVQVHSRCPADAVRRHRPVHPRVTLVPAPVHVRSRCPRAMHN